MDKGAIHIVGKEHEVRPLRFHQLRDLGDHIFAQRGACRIGGINQKEGLDLRIFQLFELLVSELETIFLRRLDVNHVQVEIFKVRKFNIGSEDWGTQRDSVTGAQKPVGLQGLEDIAHRRRSAFRGEKVKLACGTRFSAHGPHQVLMDNAFVMYQYSVWDRVIVSNDRVHKLVDECIRLESELLDRECDHLRKE